MSKEPLGYFITWTCYGTWLPGDNRGWTKWHKGDHIPQPLLAEWCKEQMVETPIVLNSEQRLIVNAVVTKHCEIRKWTLRQVNCRSTHCHVVVTAAAYDGESVRDQFKAWSKRGLKDHERESGIKEESLRVHWWTRKGSVRHLDDEDSLEAATIYVRDAQDLGGSNYGK